MKPVSHGGPSVPLMPHADEQPQSRPATPAAAEPPDSGKSALPDHEVRPGQENLQRFLATHGKTGGASETRADATADAGNVDTAEQPAGGGDAHALRRRATAVPQGRPGDRSGNRPDAAGQRVRNPAPARTFGDAVWGAMKLMTGFFALSAGFRVVRNPGDFVSHPGATLLAGLTLSERMDPQVLDRANQAVLERFGEYIPNDSRCHKVRAELSFNMPQAMAAGYYNAQRNYLGLRPYQALGAGLATAAHEYCHCYTHPAFSKALKQTPNYTPIGESITEHLSDKVPRDGRLAKLMAPFDSGYHDMKLSNGKNLVKAAEELEQAVGEATMMRAYFGGDKNAIRKLSRAAVDIFPKSVTLSAWEAIGKLGGNMGNTQRQQLAECFVGASLLVTGKVPPHINGFAYASDYLPIYDFSQIDAKQQNEIKNQAMQARERLGDKFDHAFFNFDESAAKAAMKTVRDDLQDNWKCVLSEKKSYF